jgi:hypothetical protein
MAALLHTLGRGSRRGRDSACVAVANLLRANNGNMVRAEPPTPTFQTIETTYKSARGSLSPMYPIYNMQYCGHTVLHYFIFAPTSYNTDSSNENGGLYLYRYVLRTPRVRYCNDGSIGARFALHAVMGGCV